MKTPPDVVKRLGVQQGSRVAASLRGDKTTQAAAEKWLALIAADHWHEIIADLNALAQRSDDGRWIAFVDKQPPDDENVLAWFGDHIPPEVCFFNSERAKMTSVPSGWRNAFTLLMIDCDPTHWRPLPAPPAAIDDAMGVEQQPSTPTGQET